MMLIIYFVPLLIGAIPALILCLVIDRYVTFSDWYYKLITFVGVLLITCSVSAYVISIYALDREGFASLLLLIPGGLLAAPIYLAVRFILAQQLNRQQLLPRLFLFVICTVLASIAVFQTIDYTMQQVESTRKSTFGLRMIDLKNLHAEATELNRVKDYSLVATTSSYAREVGTYNGKVVEFAYQCWGDVCPDNGSYFLRYRGVPRDQCEAAGGYVVEGFSGWGSMTYGGCSPLRTQ